MLRPYSCQLSVGAKHLEDNYRSLPKIVLQMLRPYSCQLLIFCVRTTTTTTF
ncbi:hypothetical protein [Dolichospermum sp. UHCC 0315A]|uniref:hypothetical protein n=1 Tax=Dolichospermum sp. UHCC 0315A TaxID=1914871 RepID=UPI001FED51B9|nr:hypothetical protein [Dolichospermum sp. UHCC 0315A]